MTDTLLFLHLLSAASLFAAIVAFTSLVLGARMELGVVRISLTLWYIGLVGVFIFGLALAFDIDAYDPWDGWVLIAIALWLFAGWSGDKVPGAYREAGEAGAVIPGNAVMIHWISVAVVVLLLADMIWKPWA